MHISLLLYRWKQHVPSSLLQQISNLKQQQSAGALYTVVRLGQERNDNDQLVESSRLTGVAV